MPEPFEPNNGPADPMPELPDVDPILPAGGPGSPRRVDLRR